jgi:hypothetical protein
MEIVFKAIFGVDSLVREGIVLSDDDHDLSR